MIVLIILLDLNPEFEHLFVISLICSCLPEKTRVHWQSHTQFHCQLGNVDKDLVSRAICYSLWDYSRQGAAYTESYLSLLLPRPAMQDFATKKTGANLINARSPAPVQEKCAESVPPIHSITIANSIPFTDLFAELLRAYHAAWTKQPEILSLITRIVILQQMG